MTDTPDNLTDEQRERLWRAVQDAWEVIGLDSQLADCTMSVAFDVRHAMSHAYLAGRDDERAKWRERVAGQGCICRTHAGHDLGVPCPVHPIDATGGESDGK